MTFVFPVLVGGVLLAGVPVLLHLIMRQKPKTLPFPAFRFLVQRQRSNLRKLRLRHLALLALRVLLIALVCLALARPRVAQQALSLSTERPVAAVLIFDTSLSMDYQTTDKMTRLDEAKKRGLELLGELPDGSRVLILDIADTAGSNRADWITSVNQARERIKSLKTRPAAGSALPSLEYAYRVLGELARGGDDERGRHLPRLVCVFSDRARACWDLSKLAAAQTAADGVPPALEGLVQARDSIAPLVQLLKELRDKLPPAAGQDYPDQALIASLEELQPLLPGLTKADFPLTGKLSALPEHIQRRGRDLLALLQNTGTSDESKQPNTYRDKLVKNLEGVLRDLGGAQSLFVDVGVEQPVDLAITHLNLPELTSGEPRQVFGPEDKIRLRAIVRALGMDRSAAVTCKVGTKTLQQSAELKAGESQTVLFEIDVKEWGLQTGPHQVEVRCEPADLLPFNNVRYVTFTVAEPRRVLVLVRPDDDGRAERFVTALQVLGYGVDTRDARDWAKIDALAYRAVYLFEVPAPEAGLWDFLYESVVKQGIGLGIVPAGADGEVAAYNQASARKVMPGKLDEIVNHKDENKGEGARWDLEDASIYQHPLMRPFRHWQDSDLVKSPSEVFAYWRISAYAKEKLNVVVAYQGKKKDAALVEGRPAGDKAPGKILLFTTTLDDQSPRWNNYLESKTSMFVVLVGLATQYLAGETDAPKLNFNVGVEEPVVDLPLSARFPTYALKGPVFETVSASGKQSELRLRHLEAPGNYVVEGPANKTVAGFSLNVPSAESDLSRVPAREIESLFGPDSIITAERKADIRDLLKGHWSEPVELFPPFMVLVLVFLAVENLLANKFYRREQPEGVKDVGR